MLHLSERSTRLSKSLIQPGQTVPGKFSAWYPGRSPADGNGKAKQKIAPLANAGGGDAENGISCRGCDSTYRGWHRCRSFCPAFASPRSDFGSDIWVLPLYGHRRLVARRSSALARIRGFGSRTRRRPLHWDCGATRINLVLTIHKGVLRDIILGFPPCCVPTVGSVSRSTEFRAQFHLRESRM